MIVSYILVISIIHILVSIYITTSNAKLHSLHTYNTWQFATVEDINRLHYENQNKMREKTSIDYFHNYNTPMHLAIQFDASLPVIKRLYQLYPESLERKNAEGYTPLGFACIK